MYLKSIEIQGFKSFANKTQLLFNEGVTGIVGPNGSGKSNIADAVRWVLGEQKVKSLRGASMQDVIFSGTQLRKPQGFAHVAITIDNSDKKLPVDYAEVTVSRRLYRSGESEYMINGQQVRLKDVQELFYDTGIGKEGYSIIGQGQIDAILSGKPEERRGLFDEAAGIVKYKRRKQIAEKKLESEQASLLRINDIIAELERQVGPLKKQAENAREYLKLREEQKLYDLNVFIREAGMILERLSRCGESCDLAASELADANEETGKLRRQYEEMDQALAALEEELSEKQEGLKKGELLIGNLNNQIEVARAGIEADRGRLSLFADRLSRIGEDSAEKEKAAVKYLHSLTALSEQLSLVEEKGESVMQIDREELYALREKIDRFRIRIRSLLSLSEAEEAQLFSEDGAAEEHAEQDGEAYAEPSWIAEIKSKQNELGAIREREARISSWLSGSEAEYGVLLASQKELQREINEKEQSCHMVSTRLESLRNIAERYEGYGQSIRHVMEARIRIPGVRGVVADLFRTKKEYETAIETALGGTIQNVVTDTEETAKRLVEHLKKNRFGRATFLPLSSVRERSIKEYEAAKREPGVLGLASELVSCEPEYRSICLFLLGRCLIADTMEHALSIARKYRYSLKIVTIEGELLSPGGSISGGAYKNSSSLMGRKREIDELSEKLGKLRTEAEELLQKAEALEKETGEKAEELSDFREELKEIAIEKNSLSIGIISDMKLHYSGLSQKTDFVAENIERLSGELLRLAEEKEDVLSKREEVLTGIHQKEHDISELTEHISAAEASISGLREALSEKQGERELLASGRKDFFDRREALSEKVLSLEKELMRLETQKEKEQQRLDAQTEYIWNEYELSLTGARDFYREDIGPITELRSRCAGLKAAIRALGPVNVQALEEYKEVAERYEFLSAQQADLLKSEEAILKIISGLEAGMKKQFQEKFAQIREEFDQVFKLLFGGGKGTIELVREEGEDILSAGISIVAQPPGKKLQNMMQLSGGEKALTAIALLFAIQNLKPSPFCLLDEIEAALDDSNVTRFAQYLHRLTEHTQFILITHRRGTMEAADRLYGVTMQEKGVTAMVSVDLISDRLEP